MKFSFIILLISVYILNQASINARTTQLGKNHWTFPNYRYEDDDSFHQISERRRQAGWGKRRYLTAEDENYDLPPHHPYSSQDNSVHTWFDEK